VRTWLENALLTPGTLTEEAEGYLRGRGMRGDTIQRLHLGLWVPPDVEAPDEGFRKRYGPHGEVLAGRLVCPFFSPRGKVIGFEGRTWQWKDDKRITDYRTMEAAWNPVFLGLTEETVRRLWEGGDAWVVEGLFDLAPMERIVPGRDSVLATVRAKLSDAHIEFLRRMLRRGASVHMVYDNDETGRKQTHGWEDTKTGKRRWGALEVLERVGLNSRDVPYRGGKDPGEVWDRGGENALRQAFAHVL
jgi:DNA primase